MHMYIQVLYEPSAMIYLFFDIHKINLRVLLEIDHLFRMILDFNFTASDHYTLFEVGVKLRREFQSSLI